MNGEATARGFKPLRAEPSGFQVHLLSRSDTLSSGCWQQQTVEVAVAALGQLAMLSFLLKGRYEHCRAEQSRQGPGQSRQGPGRAEQQRAAQGIVGHKQGSTQQNRAAQGKQKKKHRAAQGRTEQNRAEKGVVVG